MVSRHLDDDIPPDGNLWMNAQQFSVDFCKEEITLGNEMFFLTGQKFLNFGKFGFTFKIYKIHYLTVHPMYVRNLAN